MKCRYCDEPVYTDMTGSPVCLKHYEALLLASRVSRQGKALTLANVRVLYARQLTRFELQPEELERYLKDVAGPIEEGELPDPAVIFSEQGGFFWSDSKKKVGFRSSRGCRVFKTLFPEWETFVV